MKQLKEKGKSTESTPSSNYMGVSTMISAAALSLIRRLLQSTWSSLYAAFSSGLESADNSREFPLALEGVKCTIDLLGRTRLDFEKEAFIGSLAKCTGMLRRQGEGILVTAKQVMASATLIKVASHSGNCFLGESWRTVLQCVSMIDSIVGGMEKADGNAMK